MEEKLFLALKKAIREFIGAARNDGWAESKAKKVIRHVARDALKEYNK